MKAGWEVKPLGKVANLASGGTPLKSNSQFWDGSIAWYSSGELNDELTSPPKSRITKAGLEGSNAKLFPEGSLLIGMYDTAAMKMSILDREAAFNQAIVGVTPTENLDLKFIKAMLEAMKPSLLLQRRGVRQKNLSLAKIKSILVPLPPLEEQRRIVAVLDEAFEGLNRARENTETNLTNARELFENIREELLNSVSQSVRLKDIITIKHGYAFKSADFLEHGKYVVLTPGNYHETGGYKDRGKKQKFYSSDVPDGYLLEKGDLLVAMTEQAPGLLGSCIIVPEDDLFLHNQRLGLITAVDGREWHNEYLYHLFNLKALRKALSDTCSGATVRHTSPSRIQDVVLPYTDNLDDQRRLAFKTFKLQVDYEAVSVNYEKQLADLEDLRQSLLQKAFAGELI